MSQIVYLQGEYLPYDQAHISIEDRGFLLADGVYEVMRVYAGKIFALEEHLHRLQRSLRELRIPSPLTLEQYRTVCSELLSQNGLDQAEATIYVQITRGAYNPRTHAFPTGEVKPTMMALARAFKPYTADYIKSGVTGVTVSDNRWARCDIKTISLLPNAMAKQQAAEAGAYEAIFVRDGIAIEGSSTNFFAVIDGEVRTYPRSNYILAGITRGMVLELARELGIPAAERPITTADLARATEAFASSTTGEVVPFVKIDGKPVGNGQVGLVARQLYAAFMARLAAL